MSEDHTPFERLTDMDIDAGARHGRCDSLSVSWGEHTAHVRNLQAISGHGEIDLGCVITRCLAVLMAKGHRSDVPVIHADIPVLKALLAQDRATRQPQLKLHVGADGKTELRWWICRFA
jgi:hypothetical protein